MLYTENLFIKFTDTTDPEDCLEVLREAGLTVKEAVTYATNAYFVQAVEGTGQRVFEIAENLLRRDDVEYCHPELIRRRAPKGIFPQQWHLSKTAINGISVDAHASVAAAHELTRGEGVTIAIIDDGIDIDHPEFGSAGKILAPRDATLRTADPRPKDPFEPGPIAVRTMAPHAPAWHAPTARLAHPASRPRLDSCRSDWPRGWARSARPMRSNGPPTTAPT